jgi:hypothetical protein
VMQALGGVLLIVPLLLGRFQEERAAQAPPDSVLYQLHLSSRLVVT